MESSTLYNMVALISYQNEPNTQYPLLPVKPLDNAPTPPSTPLVGQISHQ